jgi:hypothetical protein
VLNHDPALDWTGHSEALEKDAEAGAADLPRRRPWYRRRSWILGACALVAASAATLVSLVVVSQKPIYYVLEDAVECWLLNAQHLKKVPGRKTDVTDSEWIAELVAHGLVRSSFVPPPPIRRLRELDPVSVRADRGADA